MDRRRLGRRRAGRRRDARGLGARRDRVGDRLRIRPDEPLREGRRRGADAGRHPRRPAAERELPATGGLPDCRQRRGRNGARADGRSTARPRQRCVHCLGVTKESTVAFLVAVNRNAAEVEHHPRHQPIEVQVPDERFPSRNWTA
ncbi:MAG: hypothetical protein DMF88_25720 [Acidobacteria bacterium]|nr:MAG: hypothetical protein DMF88_25720 [Acidobacteriota bacterium]